MTIASFAKPTLFVIALLTAASASVAIESARRDSRSGQASSSAIDLQADAALREISEPAERDIAADLVVATEASKKLPIGQAVLSRADQALLILGKPKATSSPDTELQMRVASESNILELQLRSKELEIDALDHEGQEREKLLEQSRKFLLRAEAESLKAKLEQQRAVLEHLKQKQDSNERDNKLGITMGQDESTLLMRALTQAEEAVSQSRETESRLREEVKRAVKEAQAQALAAQEQALATQQQVIAAAAQARNVAGGAPNYSSVPNVPQLFYSPATSTPGPAVEEPGNLKLQPEDLIKIQLSGAYPDSPIDGEFTIESMGTVPLGVAYGRVKVAGLTVLEAEEAIREHLSEMLTDPNVQVVLVARQVKFSPPMDVYGPGPASSRIVPPSE